MINDQLMSGEISDAARLIILLPSRIASLLASVPLPFVPLIILTRFRKFLKEANLVQLEPHSVFVR